MNRPFSLYLDLVRFLAAVLVVMSHYLRFGIFNGSVVAYIPELGRESVIIFFVLSGYVIAYVTKSRQLSLREYAIARCSRIYSVSAPILIIAFSVYFIAIHTDGAHIDAKYVVDKAYFYIPFHLLFLGELWNLSEVPPWLGAYWSLGYEVWYYILFGAIYFFTGASRVFIALLVFTIMGHKLWLLMPVWWAGAFLYTYQDRYRPVRNIARTGWLLTLLLLLLYKTMGVDLALRELGNHLWGEQPLKLGSSDRYLADYVVCLLVSFNFFFALHAKFDRLLNWERPIRSLSSYTFTLYLIHGVVLSAWSYFYKGRLAGFYNILIVTTLVITITIVTGMLTEQRKHVFQKFFSWLF